MELQPIGVIRSPFREPAGMPVQPASAFLCQYRGAGGVVTAAVFHLEKHIAYPAFLVSEKGGWVVSHHILDHPWDVDILTFLFGDLAPIAQDGDEVANL